MLLQALISTVLQVGLALGIGWIVYWFSGTEDSFFNWLGLTSPGARAVGWAIVATVIWTGMGFVIEWFVGGMTLENHPVKKVAAEDPNVLVGLGAVLIKGGLQTGLAEEILFRGAIGKQLVRRFDFQPGNLVQAAIFGAVHLIFIPFLPEGDSRWKMIAILSTLPFILGYVAGWLNEKFGGSSIVPGWILHGGGNAISYSYIFWTLST